MRIALPVCILLLMSITASLLEAQEPSRRAIPPRQAQEVNASPKSPEDLAQKRAALMEFVEAHHPDLKRLLGLLEERRPTQFRQAMRTLSRQFDRLNAIKDRDPVKYEIGLRLWKVHSRVEFVSAQMALRGPEKFEEQLKKLLSQQQQIKIEMQKHEVARQQQRLKRLRESLQRSRESADANVEKQFNQIVNSSKRQNRAMRQRGNDNQGNDKRGSGDGGAKNRSATNDKTKGSGN